MIRLQIVWQPRLRHNSEICRASSQTTEKRVLQGYLAAARGVWTSESMQSPETEGLRPPERQP